MGYLTVAAKRYIAEDKKRAREYQIASRNTGTWKRDHLIWRKFNNYLGSADPWKAAPEDIAGWCASLVEDGINPNSIPTYLSTLNTFYERLGKGYAHGRPGKGTFTISPARDPMVLATMRGIRRVHGNPPSRKKPISLDTLERILDHEPDTRRGKRNKALLALCWAGALRGSDIMGLDAAPNGSGSGYIEISDEGVILNLKRTKVNQGANAWTRFGIPARNSVPRYCPVVLLRDWMNYAGIEGGTLFPAVANRSVGKGHRLEYAMIREAVTLGVGRLGLQKNDYGIKSLRAGCITWLVSEGVPLANIMTHSGHSSLSNFQVYIRPVSPLQTSPLLRTRWAS
jgi:integrase